MSSAPVHEYHRHQATRGGTSPLEGLGTIIRFVLRRDRSQLPVWIGGHGLVVL